MRLSLAFLLATLPGATLAAGGMSTSPPTPTETTTQCAEGQVYDTETGACVAIQQGANAAPQFDQERAFALVRELAYAARHADAQAILATMDQTDDRVQTYWGFTHRKLGDTDRAMAAYYAALAANPDNLLARSYMGQHYAEIGAMDMARLQLTEIRARGGRESWPEKSLAWAIETRQGQSY
ncbi:MAG: tetratricopeptide repeat protein [Pseudomonadota bacterium]